MLVDAHPTWLHWLDRVPSTNTWALQNLASLRHGDIVYTPQQTAGRGQYDRVWHSPAGVLTLSGVIDRIPVAKIPSFSLATSLAVIYALEDLLPRQSFEIKWPNDIWLDRRKVAGILCELAPNQRLIVGIGLNRAVDFVAAGFDCAAIGNAISLHEVQHDLPPAIAFLERIRHYLLEAAGLFARTDLPPHLVGLPQIKDALNQRDGLFDRAISLHVHDQIYIGKAAGLDELGRLQLRDSGDHLRCFASGRIQLLD